jgi:hypothetical protein
VVPTENHRQLFLDRLCLLLTQRELHYIRTILFFSLPAFHLCVRIPTIYAATLDVFPYLITLSVSAICRCHHTILELQTKSVSRFRELLHVRQCHSSIHSYRDGNSKFQVQKAAKRKLIYSSGRKPKRPGEVGLPDSPEDVRIVAGT